VSAVIADAGPLYALVDVSDNHHLRAQSELQRLSTAGITVAVPTVILLGAYSLILYRLGIHAAFHRLSQLEGGVGRIAPRGKDFQAAVRRVRRYPDQSITLFDAVLAELSEKLSVPVWTFDHHFDVMNVQAWR
jgi:predicted nucleic acid-binding protein